MQAKHWLAKLGVASEPVSDPSCIALGCFVATPAGSPHVQHSRRRAAHNNHQLFTRPAVPVQNGG